MVLDGFGSLEEERPEACDVADGLGWPASPTSLPRVFLVSCLLSLPKDVFRPLELPWDLIFPAFVYLFLLLPLIPFRICDDRLDYGHPGAVSARRPPPLPTPCVGFLEIWL